VKDDDYLFPEISHVFFFYSTIRNEKFRSIFCD